MPGSSSGTTGDGVTETSGAARRIRRAGATETAAGRSRERYRRIGFAALGQLAARALGVLTALVSIPLTIDYLGAERFGLWTTISSVIALSSFIDLGIGYGMINVVAAASGTTDAFDARRHISSGFFLLSGLALVAGSAVAVLYPLVPWAGVFNVSSVRAASEAGPAVAIVASCFLAGLPLSLVQRLQFAYQEGFQASLWVAAGNLLGLAGVLATIAAGAGLPWLVLAMAGGPLAAALLNTITFFLRRPHLRPSLSFVSAGASLTLVRLGLLFLVMNVALAAGIHSNSIVISRVIGPEAVTAYWVPMRLFTTVPLILTLALTPFWPAYGESIARGDVLWVRRALLRSVGATLIVALPLVLFLVVFGQRITEAWSRGEVSPSFLLILVLGGWTLASALSVPVGMFLNGASILRFQAMWAVAMAAINVPLSIVFAEAWGVEGVVVATFITSVICLDVPGYLVVPRVLRAIEGSANPQPSA